MKKIIFPLKEGAKGSETSNLQDVLFLLLERNIFLNDDAIVRQKMFDALQRDYVKEVYGDATRAMVGRFQKEHGLEENGAIDKPTADAINALLHKFEFLDDDAGGWAWFIKLIWNTARTGKAYRHNKWAEIIRILNDQKRSLNAINLNADRSVGFGEKADLGGAESVGFSKESRDFLLTDFNQNVNVSPKIKGQVFLDNGLPAAKLNLRFFNKGFGNKESALLGEVETDDQGFYVFPGAAPGVNLEVRTINKDKEIALSNPKVVDTIETVLNLVVPSEVKPQISEFTMLSDNLADALKVPKTDLKKELLSAEENKNRQDLSFLHQTTGWDARLIATAATAAKVSDTTKILPDALYGAFRAGLPTDPESLAEVSPEAFAVALKQSKDVGIIALDDAQTKSAEGQFKSFALDARSKMIMPDTVSSMDDLIKDVTMDQTQKTAFKELVLTHTGDNSSLWDKARAEGISDAQINTLQLQGKFAYLTLNNASLTQLLQTEIASQDDLSQLVDKDLYRREEWANRLKRLAGSEPATRDANLAKLIPSAYTQENLDDRLNAYADDLAQKVRRSFPTHTIKRMVEKEELKLGSQQNQMKVPVQKLLEKAADKGFQLGRTPFDQFKKQHGTSLFDGIDTDEEKALAEEGVKLLTRVYQMTPSDDAMATVLELGFTSAREVAAIPKEEFVERYARFFGSRLIARTVWDKSVQITTVSFNIFTIAKKIGSTPPIPAISGSFERVDQAKENLKSLLKEYPTMESLFGSLDFCECEHCRSVLSPAAYVVDLLRFIDPSEKDWEHTLQDWKQKHNNKAYTGPEYNYLKPYDALIKRRPDLPHLPLTCENTNTAMPYIDLVNEILEYFVAHNTLDENAAHDTGEATSNELMAEPQNIIPAAYNKLKTARYPLTLPFDLWSETVRRFCEYFETPFWHLLETFRSNDELFAPAAHPASYYRAQIFAEYLGLSPNEYAIYTSANMTDWFTLYGYGSEASALENLKSAKTLSRRLNVSYKELVELLKTKFVNSNLDSLVLLRKLDLEPTEIFRFKKFTGYEPFTPPEERDFRNRLARLNIKFQPNFNSEQELNTLWTEHKFDKILVLRDTGANSNFDETLVKYADGTDADALKFTRLNLFVRLWKRLGWTIEETDEALQSFLPANEQNTGNALKTALIYFAHLKELTELINVGKNSRLKLLTLWSDLPTKGKNPLYAQLFLTRSILKDDPVFDNPLGRYLFPPNTDPANSNALLKNHMPALQSALGLTAGEIAQILQDGNTNAGYDFNREILSLANVSKLYRYGLLAKALKISVEELIILKALSGLNPFRNLNPNAITTIADDNPFNHTLEFVRRAKQIKAGAFNVRKLDYLLRHRFDTTGKYHEDSQARLVWIKTLAAQLRSIADDYAVPVDGENVSDDALRQKMTTIFAPDVVEMFMGFWLNKTVYSAVTDSGTVLPNQRLDPTRYNVGAASVSYDETRQRQQVTHTGVLTDLAKAELLTQLPPPSPDETDARQRFSDLLDEIVKKSSSQFAAFFGQHFDGLLKYEDFFGAGVTATEEKKRLELLEKILPFLQAKLARQTILLAIAAQTDGDPALIETLVLDKEFLALPVESGKSLMELFESLQQRGFTALFTPSDSTAPQINATVENIKIPATEKYKQAQWEGFVEIPLSGAYRFYAKFGKKDATAKLSISSVSETVMNWKSDQDNDEKSGFVELNAGVLYKFILEANNLQDGEFELLVKGETTSKESFGKFFVMPQKQAEKASQSSVMLSKALQLAQGLELNARDIRHILANPQGFGGVDWRKLPTVRIEDTGAGATDAAAQFTALIRLIGYAALKHEMAGGSDDLIAVLENAFSNTPENVSALCKRIEVMTRRQSGVVETVAVELKMTEPKHFADVMRLERLWQALQIVEKFGVQVVSLKKWLKPQADESVAAEIRNTIKSRYEPEAWQRIAKTIFDPLRQRQRDALVAYIMFIKEDLDSIEKLFEYFLIDPGSEPVLQTSRLRLAISSLQTFIQRCFLNLEKQVHPSVLNARHWGWMKRYRVWEANRKIFLFPENWLEPEWRDDKTHLYQELEGTLLQGDVTNQLAEDALYVYLKQLNQLARLEIVTMYVEEKPFGPPTIHVIGRTYAQPHQYFYRRYAYQMWTPWEPVTAEIDSDHVVAVVWRERLHLFWLTFLEKVEESASGPRTNENRKLSEIQLNTLVTKAVEGAKTGFNLKLDMQLNWSEYFQGEWTARESSGFGNAIPLSEHFDAAKVFVTVAKEPPLESGLDGAILINLNGLSVTTPNAQIKVSAKTGNTTVPAALGDTILNADVPRTPYFRIVSKNSRPVRSEKSITAPTSVYSTQSQNYNTFKGSGSLSVTFVKEIVTTDGDKKTGPPTTQTILSKPKDYALLPTSNRMQLPNDEFAPLLSPVFYADDTHTFFVEPTLNETTVDKWEGYTVLPPPLKLPPLQVEPPRIGPIGPIPRPRPGFPLEPRPPETIFVNPVLDEQAIYTIKPVADTIIQPGIGLQFGDVIVGSTGLVQEQDKITEIITSTKGSLNVKNIKEL